MRTFAVLAVPILALGACATTPPGPGAPQPARPVDAARFYTGVWHEIARRPMWITENCPAGATIYSPPKTAGADVEVLDTCDRDRPGGKKKTIGGPGRILDPGTNAKLRVDYPLWFDRDYWVLDRAEDYSWFISADPTMRDLYIYTRNPRVPPALRAELEGRAKALGYDVGKLEWPAQP